MGLFNFFKKAPAAEEPKVSAPSPAIDVDANLYLAGALAARLRELGFEAVKHPQYFSVIVNGELEIGTLILDHPDKHPHVLHLMTMAMHPRYFPDGIEEHIAGIGTSLADKAAMVLDNYINTTFRPIMASFSDSHDAQLDFTTSHSGRDILWHPNPGLLAFQGRWQQPHGGPTLYEVIEKAVPSRLRDAKFNWLKLYVSKTEDGAVIGECNLNNEAWDEGLDLITRYAESWETASEFLGMKQFVMFRRCDASDNG
jgi:hypothetical protein